MKKYKESSNISLIDGAYCKICGEVIVEQFNCTQLAKFEHYHWILYCANKDCENHAGEGYFQPYT